MNLIGGVTAVECTVGDRCPSGAAATAHLAGQLAEVVHRTELPFVQVIFDYEPGR